MILFNKTKRFCEAVKLTNKKQAWVRHWNGKTVLWRLFVLMLAIGNLLLMVSCSSQGGAAGSAGQQGETQEAGETQGSEQIQEQGETQAEPLETEQTGFQVCENGMTRESGKIIWATNADFAPYEYLDENGEIIGMEAEIAAYVAKTLGLELEALDMNFDSVIDSVAAGEADMGIAALTITEDRSHLVSFTDPYTDSVQVIIVKKSSDITSIENLHGKAGVLLGSFGYQYAKENITSADIERFNNRSDILEALITDKIDAALIDLKSAEEFVRTSSDTKILPERLTNESCAIAVNKENEKLLKEINAVLDEMNENGKMDEIIAKYLNN